MRTYPCCSKCRTPYTCARQRDCKCHRIQGAKEDGAWTDPGMTGTALGYDQRVTDHRTRVQERKA